MISFFFSNDFWSNTDRQTKKTDKSARACLEVHILCHKNSLPIGISNIPSRIWYLAVKVVSELHWMCMEISSYWYFTCTLRQNALHLFANLSYAFVLTFFSINISTHLSIRSSSFLVLEQVAINTLYWSTINIHVTSVDTVARKASGILKFST